MTTRVSTVADGVTALFTIPFPYLDKSHVQVMLNGVTQPASAYTWVTSSSIQMVVTPSAGVKVTRYRETPSDALTVYQSGSVLTRDQLEVDSLQALYRTEEAEGVALRLPSDHAADTLLPALVPLAPLVVNSDATGVEMGDPDVTGDMLLRGELASAAAGKGGALVAFQQSGLGMVVRELLAKGRDIVHADDRGLVGDGIADETTALQDLFNAAAGKVLMLGAGKTYGIGAAGITIPANTTIISNGSKFRKLVANTTYGIATGSDCIADLISLEIQGGAGVQDAGIKVAGSNTQIGTLRVAALVADATPTDPLAAVYIGTGTVIDKIDIGRILVSGVQVPVICDAVHAVQIGYVGFSGWKRGVYIKDCKSLTIDSGRAGAITASASGSAGQNAVLIESTTADRSCADIFINNFVSEQSPEHGFRVGGQFIARNIHFNTCASYLAGSGSAPAGGCGIKVLGPTTVTAYHEGIFVNGLLVEDASNVTGENHHIADFGLIDGLSVKGLVGRKRTRTHSAYGGLRLSKLKNASIDANITDTNIGAIRFNEVAGFAGLVAMQNVRIDGVFDTGNALSDCVTMACLDTVYVNVSVNGTLSGGRAATRVESPTGAGAYTSVSMDFDYLQQDTSGATLTGGGNSAILYSVRAVWGGTPSAKDGSTYQDFTNGVTREIRAGVWYESGERAGTWTPTLTPVTNVDTATASGAWRWSREGDIVSFSGSANIDVTTASTLSEVGVSLPVASNLTSSVDAAGTGVAYTNAILCGTVQGDPTNDRLALKWFAGTATTGLAWFFTGSYQVK